MSNKTINDALKDLFLALGGDATELSDNTKISDYIEDLKGALKDAIDDAVSEALPTVTSSDEGQVLSVNHSGKWDNTTVDNVVNISYSENWSDDGNSFTLGNLYLEDYDQETLNTAYISMPSRFVLPCWDENLVDNAVLVWDSNDSQFYPATLSIEDGQIVYTRLTT